MLSIEVGVRGGGGIEVDAETGSARDPALLLYNNFSLLRLATQLAVVDGRANVCIVVGVDRDEFEDTVVGR